MTGKNKITKKSKEKQKGFTLVEMLGVIAILAILTAIIFPLVTKYIDKGKLDYDLELEKQLLLAGKNYYASNKIKLPKRTGEISLVTALEMKTQNLINNDLTNSAGQDCQESYVVASKQGSKYKYYSCLVCNGEAYNPSSNENFVKDECKITSGQSDKEYLIMYVKGRNDEEIESVKGSPDYYIQKATYGEETELNPAGETNKPIEWEKEGYEFAGWETSEGNKITSLTINQNNKYEYFTNQNQIILYASWNKKDETENPNNTICQISVTPTGWAPTKTVTITSKDGNCTNPLTKTITSNQTITHKIETTEGETADCEVTVDQIDTIKPTATLSRSTCAKNITIKAGDTGGSGLKYYAWSSSTATPTTWTTYKGSIVQPTITGTVYLHVQDGAGNVNHSGSVTTYTSCTSGCGRTTKETTIYRWGAQTSSSCSSSNHSRTFSFRWYNCKCSMDKVTGAYCSHTQSKNTSHANSATIYYTSTTTCNNATKHYNSGIRKVCDSTRWKPANTKDLSYHGYHFYNALTPPSPYNQFKLGYWYHSGSNKNNIYAGGVDDYSAACKHACKVS